LSVIHYILPDVTHIGTLEWLLMLYNSGAKVWSLLLSPTTNLTINLKMPINYRNIKKKHYILIPLIQSARYITC
jgi:hypothetical protein